MTSSRRARRAVLLVRRAPLLAAAICAAAAAHPSPALPAAGESGPAANPACSLLSEDEVGGVLGTGAPDATDTSFSCFWATDSGTVIVSVAPGLGLDVHREAWPGGVDLTVAGFDAFHSPAADQLWVDIDGQELAIAIEGADGDEAAILAALAELAAPRVASSTEEPGGTLASAFPEEVGGSRLVVAPVPTDQVAAFVGADGRLRGRIDDRLAEMGRTISDLEVAVGVGEAGQLVAFRIAGGEAGALATLLAEALLGGSRRVERDARTIAGKEVTVLSTRGGPTAAVHVDGDILWLALGTEPALTALLGALPDR